MCVIDMKQWVKGRPEFKSVYDGKTYLFPGAEQKAKFDKDPARYAPAAGGGCAVCLVDMNKRIPGVVNHAALHAGRLFLFPGAEQRERFLNNPNRYANADLALGGSARCAA